MFSVQELLFIQTNTSPQEEGCCVFALQSNHSNKAYALQCLLWNPPTSLDPSHLTGPLPPGLLRISHLNPSPEPQRASHLNPCVPPT